MSYPSGSLLSVLSGRVKSNLEFIEAFAPPWHDGSSQSDQPPYEDTQLLVSLLAVLIFPHERTPTALGELLDGYHGELDSIVDVKFSNAVDGKVNITQPDGLPVTIDPKSGRELPRLLRNSIAHFNIRALEKEGRFGGIRVWNRNRKGDVTFVADLDFDALRPLAHHILCALHIREGLQLDDPPDPLEELSKQGKGRSAG